VVAVDQDGGARVEAVTVEELGDVVEEQGAHGERVTGMMRIGGRSVVADQRQNMLNVRPSDPESA